jgi:hypothetical protein
MHIISFFSRFVFDEFITKGGEYGHKVGRTLANWVDERRNMINDYLRGRALLGGVWILRFCFDFELFLLFSCLLLAFAVFLLLDDLLELFLAFWSSSCASWGLEFKLQTLCLCCQWTHQGGD